MKLIYSHTIFS